MWLLRFILPEKLMQKCFIFVWGRLYMHKSGEFLYDQMNKEIKRKEKEWFV